jgi:hypothetical protein
MARFYGEVGNKTSMGDASSGLSGHIRGWRVGAEVRIYADSDTDNDVCSISATGGSAGSGSTFLGELTQSPSGIVFTPSRQLRDAILKAEGKRPIRDDIPTSVVIQ